MDESKIPKLICLKCEHIWYPRKPVVKQCPNCRTVYFNIDRGHLSKEKAKVAVLNNMKFMGATK